MTPTAFEIKDFAALWRRFDGELTRSQQNRVFRAWTEHGEHWLECSNREERRHELFLLLYSGPVSEQVVGFVEGMLNAEVLGKLK